MIDYQINGDGNFTKGEYEMWLKIKRNRDKRVMELRKQTI